MTRTLRTIFVVILMSVCISASAFAQSKEAQEKYYKGLKELDWRERIGGAGAHGRVDRLVTPPNAVKAEKLFREAAAVAPDWPLPWYVMGDMNFVQKKYSAAAEGYAKANEVDSQSHKLDKETRLDMLDQLGLSWALAKNYDSAKSVYLAALKENPNYPQFEYNLSCVYAEQGDLENALTYLKKAWAHKEDMPEGIAFPDPRKDDSYKKFWDDPEFKEAVQEMVI
jgi:tetratricopeptide (TPR) repeat protein